MSKIKLTLEYDGTAYVGWQWQPNGPSIQAEVETALAKILKAPVRVSASGRTDAGVHALGQTATFTPPRALPMSAYVAGLSSLLPRDIAVLDAREVPDTFDARRSARGKHYRYLILNRPTRAPLRRLQRWEIFRPLDVEAMRRAATCLIGEHDFSAFRASNCEAKNPIKRLTRADICRVGDDEIALDFIADGFLKQMVRNLVGTLVEVGLGRRPPESVEQTLRSLDRQRAGPTAPPQGLFLVEVFYGEEAVWPFRSGPKCFV
ncbi:MAG: tRNA pseudouridine(38-40) synthase TruA [Myxococcales bacterium]|nr:tRNA pseudouridine(38-40) synthase TruA [Myxococcales bacterium]